MTELPVLHIFVAMPSSDLGPHAKYKTPSSIEREVLTPVCEVLENRLGRRVELVIEKSRRAAGSVHKSMFSEAREADVYIADLTGANPNVYLELGVRWALRDCVTVPICQDPTDLRFNVLANRAIIYYPDIRSKAIDEIVDTIINGLETNKTDSPVRDSSEFVVISRAELESIRDEVDRLKKESGEELLQSADAVSIITEKEALLEKATQVNPASHKAWLQLGLIRRDLAKYDDAVVSIQTAIRLGHKRSIAYRELGVTYSKRNESDAAVKALREAVRLDPTDVEAWSNLGGALRRLGTKGGPSALDRKFLLEARESYKQAKLLDKFNVCASLNVSRLDVLLATWEPDRLKAAKEEFRKQGFLCRFAAEHDRDDYWRKFDLAECLLFSGQIMEARQAYQEAIDKVPKEVRLDKLSSVAGPLRDLLAAGSLDASTGAAVRDALSLIDGTLP